MVADSQRAGEVMRGIRSLVRKEPSVHTLLNLNAIITDTVRLVSSDVLNRESVVMTELDPHLPQVQGTLVQIQQVLLNLIVNALEAMGADDEGPKELLISTGKVEPGGALVAVRDSGPGLEALMLERVFESFYTTKPTGFGLGLSICRSIIEAHGGRLWASKNQRRGATFQFTLPGAGSIPS